MEDLFTELIGAPGEIRTPDQVVRSHLLYPAELRVRSGGEVWREIWFWAKVFCVWSMFWLRSTLGHSFKRVEMIGALQDPFAGRRLSNVLRVELWFIVSATAFRFCHRSLAHKVLSIEGVEHKSCLDDRYVPYHPRPTPIPQHPVI